MGPCKRELHTSHGREQQNFSVLERDKEGPSLHQEVGSIYYTALGTRELDNNIGLSLPCRLFSLYVKLALPNNSKDSSLIDSQMALLCGTEMVALNN